ncbi:unnamed protein product, partial [Prunus brigantina]
LTVVPTLPLTRRHTRRQRVVPKAITPRRKNSKPRLKTPILAPPVSWLFPATMAADRGGERLRLEEGSFVVHLALVLPESKVGAERKQLPKSAG